MNNKSRRKNMTSHKEKARELFLKGYNCSQSVFASFSDVTGIDEETSLKLSSSFGGGMGRMREVCGAMSGSFMVLGILFGYSKCDDEEKKSHYGLIQNISNEFKKDYGSIICRELLSNLKPGTGSAPTKRTADFYKKRPCLEFVEYAVELTDRIIDEKSQKEMSV